jgi:hypothetical protein
MARPRAVEPKTGGSNEMPTVSNPVFKCRRSSRHSLISKVPSRFANLHKGRREGMDGYFKSRWEANVGRYLDFLKSTGKIIDWKYEPETFWFEGIRRGVCSFKPDFKVIEAGRIYYWEVKGYMDARSKTKIKRMAKYFPDVTVHVIGKDEYKAIAKWSRLIPGWED